MLWEVEYTDEFGNWWEMLDKGAQRKIAVAVTILEKCGPNLGFPYSSGVIGSRHPHMRELHVQVKGRPFRILYAFDPRRCAILLIGGDKTGLNNWYEIFIPIADELYDLHLMEIGHKKHD